MQARGFSMDEATPLLEAGAQPRSGEDRSQMHHTIASVYSQTRHISLKEGRCEGVWTRKFTTRPQKWTRFSLLSSHNGPLSHYDQLGEVNNLRDFLQILPATIFTLYTGTGDPPYGGPSPRKEDTMLVERWLLLNIQNELHNAGTHESSIMVQHNIPGCLLEPASAFVCQTDLRSSYLVRNGLNTSSVAPQ